MYRFYSQAENNSPRITVVGQFENNILKMAVARCSKKDNFIRKKGRLMAEGRLLKGKLFTEINMTECSTERFIEEAKRVVHTINEDTSPIILVNQHQVY